MSEDIAAACGGRSRGRTLEVTKGDVVHRLQMWIEPAGVTGLACLSVLPDLQK
jgi:hypothetical protein